MQVFLKLANQRILQYSLTTEEWTVDRNKFIQKVSVSPFDGMTVKGKAKLTVVNGEVVMKEGVVLR